MTSIWTSASAASPALFSALHEYPPSSLALDTLDMVKVPLWNVLKCNEFLTGLRSNKYNV